MRSLFLKIFLCFWLATILLAAEFVAFDQWNRHEHGPSHRRAVLGNIVSLYGDRALQKWERGGSAALRAYCERLRQTAEMHAVLLDEHGTELAEQTPPAGAAELAARVRATGEVQVEHTATGLLVGARVSGANEQPYVFVTEITRSPLRDVFANPTTWMWRLAAVIVTGGIVCYGLARYLTAPIRRLRAAAGQLARGDLTARAGARAGRRRDEIGDLGRDFDFMAERVEALVAAERRLLRDISHELRSPLARLNVALGLARQNAAPAAGPALDRIEREAERLNELIGQLLTLTRLESAAQTSDATEVQLGELVAEVAADGEFEAATRNRHVRALCAHDCVTRGTAALLRSALENVVRNAVQHTADGTEVNVTLRGEPAAAPATAVIEVRDHGPGVPEAALQNIFRPFYRIADARDRKTGGVGLGLAITERAIRLHGGTVRAANAPDGGLIVRIELPCLRATPA